MPRIPDNANNEASSMWKLNDVYVAENGGEWPDPYVPYTPSQVYISRNIIGSGGNALTDGSTTNSFIDANPFQWGTGYTMGSSWGYGGNNTDAICFNLTNNWGHTGTYRITHFGLGALGSQGVSDSIS